jgi:LEA14-like dessication related protein
MNMIKRSKLIPVTIMLFLVMSVAGCRGTVPGPFNQPIQKAVEQAVKAPGIDLHVTIGSLSPSGLDVNIAAGITNFNSVALDIGDLQVIAKGGTGRTYVQDTMPGGSVAPNSNMTFTNDLVIPLDVLSERSIVIAVDTRAGVAGITLPVAATVTVNLPDIQHLVSTPGIALSVNIGQLSSNGLSATLQAVISNPNPLSVNLGNMQIVLKGQSGNTLTTSSITGGSIAPNSSGTFTSNIQIPLQVLNERTTVVTINTSAGVAGLTLPIAATITVNLPDIQHLVSTPGIALSVNIGQLSSNGLSATLQAVISNPNPLSVNLGNMQIVLKGQSGNTLTTSSITGGSIAPNSSGTFTSNIQIPLQVLNERTTVVTINTSAGVAGITLPVTATVTVNLPDIQHLVSIPQVTIDASPSIAYTFPLPSLRIQTDVIVANSNSFGLVMGELHVNLFKSDGSLLKTIIIPGATIYPNSSQTFSNSIILGSNIILGLIGSSSLTIEADSQAGISGVNDTIPIKVTFNLKLPTLPHLP